MKGGKTKDKPGTPSDSMEREGEVVVKDPVLTDLYEEDEEKKRENEQKRPTYGGLNVVITKSPLMHWQELRIPGKLPERRSYMASCVHRGK